jgi:hypothetical protein
LLFLVHSAAASSLQTESMLASPSTETIVQSLWSSALEIFFHQILFVRRLYPKDTFAPARFLGVQCRVNRHQDVVSYISEAVKVVVPALIQSVSNEVSLEIFDHGNSKQREVYFLKFAQSPVEAENNDINAWEREMQYLILSVYSLESESPGWRSSATFKIKLFLSGNQQNCADLNQALSNGKWFCPRTDSKNSRADENRCPVYDMKQCPASFSFFKE